MKKIFILLVSLLIGSSLFAYGTNDDDFTWHDYEVLCWRYDVEPTWEQYEYLVNHPQCITIEEENNVYDNI
jgi:hypothetical protein